MNVNQIEIALSQKIDSNSSNLDLLTYSKALSFLKTNGIFTASNYGNLPSAASNEGKLYFVEDLEILFWSDGTDWLQLLSKSAIEFQLWSWGSGFAGRLGDGTTTNKCSPVRELCSATDWCQVSSGNSTSAIKTSGELWGWGFGLINAAIGDGTLTSRCSPVREFCSATDWCQVSINNNHTAAIKTSGQLWAWGDGACGQLGDGTTVKKCSPVREICSATDWCQVSAGGYHTAAIKTTGQLWVWGRNCCGALGDGTTTNTCSPVREFCSATDWRQVSAGITNTMAIKTSGELWVWGCNNCGQLGDGTTTARCSPVREFCSATNWCQVYTAFQHAAAIKTSGELWVWGDNTVSRLGDGTTTNRCSPVREFCSATDWCQVRASGYNGAAVKTSGTLWVWGSNNGGQLGDGTTTDKCSPVREICSATDWSQVTVGGNTTTAIKLIV
jgi:alpha-tubulin suppressor-like RCC1 family protein